MGDARYCYICAAGRSGSTFFDLLLGGHSRIASLGEFSFFGKALALNQSCGCGADLLSCAAWAKVLDRLESERGVDLRRDPYAMRQWDARAVRVVDKQQQTRSYLLARGLRSHWMSLRSTAPAAARRLIPIPPSLRKGLENTFYLYDLIRDTWGVQLVVDSSKNIHKALSLNERDPEHVRVVLLTRDGRGVFHSRLKTGLSPKASIAPWVRYHSQAERLLARQLAPAHLKAVRYEDLATETGSVLQQMCEFLGVPFEPAMIDLSAGERHIVNGNRNAASSRKKGVRFDENWREGLSSSELAYFQRKAGRLNGQLGYGA